jgi:hypothetical protein
MSWDVMVFDLGENPPPIGEMGADFKPKSLGPVSELRRKLSLHFSNINWSDPSWGVYDGDGFSVEFSVGKEQMSDGFMIHVRGSGNAIAALLKFSIPNGWSLFDCSTGDFIDHQSPSDSGWVGFQNYRDRVIKDNDA